MNANLHKFANQRRKQRQHHRIKNKLYMGRLRCYLFRTSSPDATCIRMRSLVSHESFFEKYIRVVFSRIFK